MLTRAERHRLGGVWHPPPVATPTPEPDPHPLAPFLPFGIGFGCARLTMAPWAPDPEQGVATIHAALSAGIRLLDTADCYVNGGDPPGTNEVLVRRALDAWSGDADAVLVATKGGDVRNPDRSWGRAGRPEQLRAACDASLSRLGVERIGLYQFHRPDPDVPFLESIGALAELAAAGKIARVGLSNVDAGLFAAASSIVEVVSVQARWNVACPFPDDLLARARDRHAVLLGYAPLEHVRTDIEAAAFPRLVTTGRELGLTPRQVALALLRGQGDHVAALIGATSPDEIAESSAVTEAHVAAVLEAEAGV